jgi:hypothetical protein
VSRVAIIVLVALAASACIKVDRYTATGTLKVNDSASPARRSVLYWHADVGRLWYLKRVSYTENTAMAAICQSVPVELVDTGNAQGIVLEASDQGNSLRTHELTSEGKLALLAMPERQRAGAPTCGELLRRDARGALRRTHFADIEPDTKLVLAVTCSRDSGAALQPDLYEFGPVEVARSKDKPTLPPRSCAEAAAAP